MERGMHAAPIEPERLLSHAGGLRALALQLLGDAHAAEDVLQETFVRALSAPPRDQDHLGGWLAQVARGLALNRRRNEAHRGERERRYARELAARNAGGDGGGSDYDGAQRGEVLRALVEEVLALDEPYKSMLLMRYFEGLTPTQIAERTHSPLATIASRLARGQAELRTRLERRLRTSRGGFEGALALLAGPQWTSAGASTAGAAAKAGSLHAGAPGAASAPGATTWLGAKSAWIGATVLVLGALVVVLLGKGAESNPARGVVAQTRGTRSAGGSTGAPASAANVDALGGVPATAAADREALAHAAPGGPSAKHDFGVGPFEFEVDVTVLDGKEHSGSAVAIFAAPEGHVLNQLGSTDWSGRLRAKWRGFERSIALVVQAGREGYGASPLTSIVLHEGVLERIQLALVEPTEPGLAETAPMVETVGTGWVRTVAGVSMLGGDGPSAPRFERDEHENGVFVDPLLAPPRGADARTLSDLPIVGSFFRARLGEQGDVVWIGPDAGASIGVGIHGVSGSQFPVKLSGTVVDGEGVPVPALAVSIATESMAFGSDATTDEHGRFGFQCPVGAARLIAGSPGSGFARAELVLEPGEREVELRLDATRALALRLTDENQKPLVSWRVEAWMPGDARACITSAKTRFDGRALLALPTSGPYELLAFPLVSATAPPVTIASNVWTQAGELALAVRGGNALANFDYFLEDASPAALGATQVRLWRADGRAGVRLPRAPAAEGQTVSNTWLVRGAVPGRYTIEVLSAPIGSRREVAIEFPARRPDEDASHPMSLGYPYPMRLGTQPTLELRLAQPGVRELAEATLWRIDRGSIVRSTPFSLALPGALVIPTGATTLELERHALGHPAPGELEDDSFGVDAAARDSGAAAPVESVLFEAESTLTSHELAGAGRQVLELEPVRSKKP